MRSNFFEEMKNSVYKSYFSKKRSILNRKAQKSRRLTVFYCMNRLRALALKAAGAAVAKGEVVLVKNIVPLLSQDGKDFVHST